MVTAFFILPLNFFDMDTNYSLVVLAVIVAVCLIVFLIVRNKKDRRKFEEDVNQPDVPPEKHDDQEGKI